MSHKGSANTAYAWSEFASEPESITGSSPQGAAVNASPSAVTKVATLVGGGDDLKGLLAFPSEVADDAPNALQPDTTTVVTTAAVTESTTRQAAAARWIPPVVAAFVFGAVSVLVTMQVLERRSSDATARVDAPLVSDGISGSLLAAMSRIQMRPPAALVTRRAPVRTAVPSAADATIPIAMPDGVVTTFRAPEPLMTLPGSDIEGTAKDEQAVRRKIRSYEEAYQGVELRNCSVIVVGEQATAECRGALAQAPSPENPAPVPSEYQWVFRLRRDGSAWKIEEISRSSAVERQR